ncbi:MAG: multicopper oxidase domain-containing protein [Acidimicrobiia bacterium]|nr:multicopper oxidase domain-containing protein [Acidimicrobiia bacterium]
MRSRMPATDDKLGLERGGVDRRSFLALVAGGVGGAALVGGTAAASWPGDASRTAPTADSTADHTATSGSNGHSGSAADMDLMHKEGIDKLLANAQSPITAGVGAQELSWRMEDGVRVFELTCSAVEWEVVPGQFQSAFAYNRDRAGPTLRVVEGQPVRVHVRNDLDQSTSVHWHGQRVPNGMDGVPFIPQPPIEPGAMFTYEFVPGPFGSHIYHSHHNAAEQVS